MTTESLVSPVIRDQCGDHQPSQIAGVNSMERGFLLQNVVSTAKVARLFGLPIGVHAGTKPASRVALAVELQRD